MVGDHFPCADGVFFLAALAGEIGYWSLAGRREVWPFWQENIFTICVNHFDFFVCGIDFQIHLRGYIDSLGFGYFRSICRLLPAFTDS